MKVVSDGISCSKLTAQCYSITSDSYLVPVQQMPLKTFVHKSAGLLRYMGKFGVAFQKQRPRLEVIPILNVTMKFFVNFSPLQQPLANLVTLFHNIELLSAVFSQETFIVLHHLRLSWTDKKGLKNLFEQKAKLLNIVNIIQSSRKKGSFENL